MTARYTLIIGSKRTSSWSLRPWLVMKTAGIPFEEILVTLRQPETPASIRVHSPSGKVPALKILQRGKSQTVWDTLAICETLAERHPGKHLWPSNAQARAEARSVSAEMHSGFFDVRRALSMDFGAKLPSPPPEDSLKSQVDRIIAIWTSALERHKGDFLFGKFSIADAFYAPVCSRFETYGVALPKPAAAYCKRIMGLPPMKEWRKAALAGR